MYLPLGAYAAWTAFPGVANKDFTAIVIASISSLIVGLIIAIMTLILSTLITSILPNKPGSIVGEHVFTLTDAKFQENNSAGSVSIALHSLKYYETPKHVFLVMPTNVGFVIPKHALETSPEFFRALKDRTKAA
jgi:hypothetical protein